MDFTSIEEYLKPSRLCDFHDAPDIRKLAVSLTTNAPTATSKAENLYEFVKELQFRYDDWDVKASETLSRGWGMCSGKVNLLVAMLMFISVPARYVVIACRPEFKLHEWMSSQSSELARVCENLPQRGTHVVAEALIDNWKTYDVARDTGLERGYDRIGIPFDILRVGSRAAARYTLSDIDTWSQKRQSAVHLRDGREETLALLSRALDTLRRC